MPMVASRTPKRRYAPLADAGDRGGRVLDLLRVDVVSAQNDEIFHTAGDEQFVVGPVAEVARVHPAVMQGCARGPLGCGGSHVSPTDRETGCAPRRAGRAHVLSRSRL